MKTTKGTREVQLIQYNEKAGIVFRKNNNPTHGGFMWIKYLKKKKGIPFSNSTVFYRDTAVFNNMCLWCPSQWPFVPSQGDTQPTKWDRPPREFYRLQLTNQKDFPKTSVRAAREHAQSSLEARGSVSFI